MRAAVTIFFFLSLWSQTSLVHAQSPDIDVMPNSFDYGNVTVGEIRDRSFAVSNESTTTSLIVFASEIVGNDADQFRIVSGGGGFILAPSATRLINVRYEPSSLGQHTATLRFENDDPNENPFDVSLFGTGSGAPIIEVTPITLQFGNVLINTTEVTELVVSNQGLAPLNITMLEFAGPDASLFNLVEDFSPVTLNPLEQTTILVGFTPIDAGDKNARLLISNNDPERSPLEVALAGRGTTPMISLDKTIVDFGEVKLGNNSQALITVSNEGLGDLIVDSLKARGPASNQFTTPGLSSFVVRPDGMVNVTLQFEPFFEGLQNSNFVIFSNDPDQPETSITLQGTTLSPTLDVNASQVDFGQLLSGLESSQTIVITNTGRADLNIAYLLTGGDSLQFALDEDPRPFRLSPSESGTITLLFKPTIEGQMESILRLLSTDPKQPQLDIPLKGISTNIQFDSSIQGILGRDLTLTFSLPAGFQPLTQELFYRGAGETDYRSIGLSGEVPNIQGTIPGVTVQLGGVEYYVQLTAESGVATLPPLNPQEQPLFLPSIIDSVETPVAQSPWNYRMFSIPFRLNAPDIESTLFDDYGQYNTRKWRLFRWLRGDYLEYPALDAFETGKAFWLITNDGTSFDVEGGISTDSSKPFDLVLQPGWNQIGNPFAFPITWPRESIDPRIEAPVAF